MPIPFPEIDLIIFDKDGVLVDLTATWLPMVVGIAGALEARAHALGDGSVRRDALLKAVGIDMVAGSDDGHVREDGIFASGVFPAVRAEWARVAPVLAPLLGDWEAFRPDIDRIIDEKIRGKTKAFGDVAGELRALRAKSKRLAIATNDIERTTRINFDDLGIADFFDAVLAADSGHGKKPEPDMVLEICRRVKVPPARAVMIGDTISDWGAARGAGLAGFIAIAPTAPDTPDYLPDADLVLRNIEGLAGRFGYSGK